VGSVAAAAIASSSFSFSPSPQPVRALEGGQTTVNSSCAVELCEAPSSVTTLPPKTYPLPLVDVDVVTGAKWFEIPCKLFLGDRVEKTTTTKNIPS
jgi:hypothetical protein